MFTVVTQVTVHSLLVTSCQGQGLHVYRLRRSTLEVDQDVAVVNSPLVWNILQPEEEPAMQ